MKTLYFVRHAESQANEQNLLASRRDFPLSAAGERQAAQVADAFMMLVGDDKPQLVVSSPLLRARQTAAAFIKAASAGTDSGSLPLIIRDELVEQELGIYSGLAYEELEDAPGYVHERSRRWDWVPDGGGESYSMIAERVKPFFAWLDKRYEDSILVVSHAVTMRLVRGHLENTLPSYPLEIARNGEIWKIEYSSLGTAHFIESLYFGDPVPERRA